MPANTNKKKQQSFIEANVETWVSELSETRQNNGFLKSGLSLGDRRVVNDFKSDFEYTASNGDKTKYSGLVRVDNPQRGMGLTVLAAWSRSRNDKSAWEWLADTNPDEMELVTCEGETTAEQLASLLSSVFGEDWDGTPKEVSLRAVAKRRNLFGQDEFVYEVVSE